MIKIRSIYKYVSIFLIFILLVGVTIAANDKIKADKQSKPNSTKIKDGSTAIDTELSSKSNVDYHKTIMKYTEEQLSTIKFPYEIVNTTNNTVIIESAKWNTNTEAYEYTLTCTKDGNNVELNNPYTIYNPPYEIIISTTKNAKTKDETFTSKEDPIGAISEFFIEYCNKQPVDKSKSKDTLENSKKSNKGKIK